MFKLNLVFIFLLTLLFSVESNALPYSCESPICGNGNSCSISSTSPVSCSCYVHPENTPSRPYCGPPNPGGVSLNHTELFLRESSPVIPGFNFTEITKAKVYQVN